MAQQNDTGLRTLVAAAALSKFTRLKQDSSGQWAVAGAGEEFQAIAQDDYASAAHATGRLFNHPGTTKVLMATTSSINSILYGAASGKFSTTVAGRPQAIAMEASDGDGAQIEAMLLPSASYTEGGGTEAHTADDTLLAGESGSVHTNAGAGGAITITLPAALPGMHFYFKVVTAQNLILEGSGAETIDLPSTFVAQANITANAAGEYVILRCFTAGAWQVVAWGGTWT